MDDKLNCKICGREFKNFVGLVSHIQTHKISSKEYYDLYLKKENEGLCLECGKETYFKNINKGYCKYCCYRCVYDSKEIKEKKKQTMVERYGVEHPFQNKEIREKQKQTNLKKYGFENPLQSEEIKEKYRQTNLKKYGFENPSQSEEIKEKKKQTSLENYGVEYYAQTEEWKSKMKNGGGAYRNSFIKNPSKPQLELFNLVKEIHSDAKLNYQILNYSVDIVIPSKNIAIEYDGSYWHQDKEKDDLRQNKIMNEGWNFLRYRDMIPTKDELTNDINNIIIFKGF